MIAKRIIGATCRVHNIEIKATGNPLRGDGHCESAWTPTPAELEMLNNGGAVILCVTGWHPPAALYVEPSSRQRELALVGDKRL